MMEGTCESLYFLRDNEVAILSSCQPLQDRRFARQDFEVRHVEKGDNEEQSRNTFFGPILRDDRAVFDEKFCNESGNSKNR